MARLAATPCSRSACKASERIYTVVASNSAGTVTSNGATLSVAPPPAAPVIRRRRQVNGGPGQSVTFTASAAARGAGAVAAQRQRTRRRDGRPHDPERAGRRCGHLHRRGRECSARYGTGAVLTLAVVAPVRRPAGQSLDSHNARRWNDAFTVGTVIGGAGTSGAAAAVRAVRPTLAQFGVSETARSAARTVRGRVRDRRKRRLGWHRAARGFSQVRACLRERGLVDAPSTNPAVALGDKSVQVSRAGLRAVRAHGAVHATPAAIHRGDAATGQRFRAQGSAPA